MPICGDLGTMSLVDLLRWAHQAERTGVLEVERNQICRRIEFRKGWIGACSSDDPPARLGHRLLSRGKIDEIELRWALQQTQKTGQSLGVVLMQMGRLTRAELARYVADKAEETLQGLFEWEDAAFRFHEGATLDPDQIEVHLSVDEIIEKGMQRRVELQEIRRDFPSSGIVLRRVPGPVTGRWSRRPMARRIFESIDGSRPIGEVLLHAHASAFLVIKLLHRLHRAGLVVIVERRPVDRSGSTLLDVEKSSPMAADGDWSPGEIQQMLEGDLPASSSASHAKPAVVPRDNRAMRRLDLDEEVEVATRLLARGEFAAALELLTASSRAHPTEGYLRLLIERAEHAYLRALRRHGLGYERTPVPAVADLTEEISVLPSEEAFLLTIVDGGTNVRSILGLAPMREIDVLRGLEQLIDRGLVRMQAAGESEVDAGSTVESRSARPGEI